MAKEKREPRPAPKKYEPRLMLVLERMATNIDHNPGEVIMHDGPETFAIRELTDAEIEARERALGLSLAPEPDPEPGTDEAFQQAARETVILNALHSLDHNDPANWTESGQPALAAISRALVNQGSGKTETSRAEVRKFAPNFRRTTGGADGE